MELIIVPPSKNRTLWQALSQPIGFHTGHYVKYISNASITVPGTEEVLNKFQYYHCYH